MDRVAKLVAAGLIALAGASAHAGYAYPADPTGFTRSGGAGFSGYGYATSANDSWYGRIVHQRNGLRVPVPGRPVTMPVSYRLAANAPRIAAGVLFAHPALRTAVGIAAWLGAAKLIWDEASKTWRKVEGGASEGGLLWRVNSTAGGDQWYPSKQEACEAAKTFWISQDPANEYISASVSGDSCILKWRQRPNGSPQDYNAGDFISKENTGMQCPVGWTETPAGCLSPALQQPQFEDELVPLTMPSRVPQELPPGTPLPVEPAPGPWINPEPGPDPSHRPLFVPTGDPIPNPDYDPNAQPGPNNQPWLQPGIRLNPSPTPGEPWRLNLEPVNRPQNTNEPMPGPQPEEGPDPGTKPRPEDPMGLCEQFPDILACAKLDTPDTPDIPESEKPISITPDAGWGADGGTCPAPRMLIVQGRQVPIPFDLFCTYMDGLRPIIIAMAWLSAAFILVGAREGN